MGHIDDDGRFLDNQHPALPPDKIALDFNDPVARPALFLLSDLLPDFELSRAIRERLCAIQRGEHG